MTVDVSHASAVHYPFVEPRDAHDGVDYAVAQIDMMNFMTLTVQ